MNHNQLAAAAMLACACLAAPAAADEADRGYSFEDRVRDVVNIGFEPDWRFAAADLLGLGAPPERAAMQWPTGSSALFAQHLQADRRKDWGDSLGWPRDFESRKDWGDPIKQGIFGHGFGHGFGHRGHGWIDPHCIPAVPEPSGLALMAGGLMAVAAVRRRRR